MAFEKGITIVELFINSIKATYQKLTEDGYYENTTFKDSRNNFVWKKVAHIPLTLFGYLNNKDKIYGEKE